MIWVGLTGGIASGKSTVAGILAQSGYEVVDADFLAREVVKSQSSGFEKIVKLFGRTIVQADGELDRKKLGDIVFSDPQKRLELENITHPLIQKRVEEIKKNIEKRGDALAFYDVPLLFEKKLEKNFDAIVVVASSQEQQIQRLMKRNNLEQGQAKARIQAQIPIEAKVKLTEYVIWNSGSLEDLTQKTLECVKKLTAAFTTPKNSQK